MSKIVEEKTWLCPAPFEGLTISPTGHITLCCVTPHEQFLGHISQYSSLEKAYNSEPMNLVRQMFTDKKGRNIPQCKVCWDKIDSGEQSYFDELKVKDGNKTRPHFDEDFEKEYKTIRFLEFSTSNICNATCSMCNGLGETITNPCLKCSGTGQIKKQKTISVSIPSGVDTGTRIRIAGEGERGQRGAGSGDLYMFINVQKDKLYDRDEENLFCHVPISITTAILGGEIEVPTIEGKKVILTIPPGTQSATQFRFKSKGMTILRQNRRGHMYAELVVEIPVNLTNKQKSILKEFENEGGTSKAHSPKSQSFFKKLKEVWEELT